MNIFTNTPRERYVDAMKAGLSFIASGRLGEYDLLRADYPDESFELFVMDGDTPAGSLLLHPWDEPEGYQVRHASVADSHRQLGLIRKLYLHLIGTGMTLVSDSERSPEAERMWRWLASNGQVGLSLLPAVPDEGMEGELPVASVSALDAIEARDEWHYVARGLGMTAQMDGQEERIAGAPRTVYHVTPARNLSRIRSEGLIPRVGARSKRLGEKVPAVFVFPTIDDVDVAMDQWLLDEFPESTRLALLKVDLPPDLPCHSDVEYEIGVRAPIPPCALTVLSTDLGNEVGVRHLVEPEPTERTGGFGR